MKPKPESALSEPARKNTDTPPPSRLARLTRLSAAAILAERGLRAGAALATLALVFLTLSWLGLWSHVGPAARLIAVALFAQAALYVVARELLRGMPSREAALKRLDAEAGGLLPATSLEDHLASGADDPVTATLWDVHRRRLEQALGRIRIAPPRPRLAERDPFALRAFALVAAFAAAFVAGDERGARLGAAFDWRGVGFSGAPLRLDAWLDPPPYTGRQPLVLDAKDVGQTLEAPVNSVLHVRLSGSASVETSGALTPLPAPAEKPRTEHEQQFRLTGPARLILPDGRVFDFAALPDQPPKATLTEAPQNNSRGSMTLSYRLEDDYGVVGAEAVVSRPNGSRTLYPPPRAPLSLPSGRAGLGEARSTVDFGDSPWAGARAILTLLARDEAGNEGFSQPVEIVLPQRRFTKPLARALVEQRRNLALDPDQRFKVLAALEALSLAPEVYDTPSGIYLGLREARRGLEGRRSDDDLRGVADLLWAMALSLENGDLSQAERDLRAAERDLREALAKGASPEEIARLTQELRQAMDKFLQGLAEQANRENYEKGAREPSGDGRDVSEQDLKSMLDEMAQAGQSGDMAQAQKLLDDLQDMLENLQASPGAAASAERREMQRALSELDRLTREQQQLRDETFRGMESEEALRAAPGEEQPQGRGGRPQGRAGAKDQGERQKQQGLRERLERQRDALRKGGAESPGELDDADKAMKEAEQALGQPGGRRGAVDAQGRALQALRRGADQLAAQMRGEGEEGSEGQGQGGEGQGGRGARASRNGRDPLGRTAGRGRGYDNKSRYDPLGLPPAMRAHRVQEELRRRLGQPERPAEELDYLQRLLQK